MIPRRIIQTHRNRTSMPQIDLECHLRVKEIHPDWEVVFYSDYDCFNFVRNWCPKYVELYDWLPRPVMRADLFRILAIQYYGGFYLDTDVWLNLPLDDLCSHQAVFPWEAELSPEQFEKRFPPQFRGGVAPLQVGNYAFGAIAKHQLLQEILDEMVVRTEFLEIDNLQDVDVLFATGPDLVSTIMYRSGLESQRVTILEGVPYCFGKYGTHRMSGSWRSFK